jgi:hypothetical protein
MRIQAAVLMMVVAASGVSFGADSPKKKTSSSRKPVAKAASPSRGATGRVSPPRREQAKPAEDSFSAEVRINGMVLGNFFQAPEGLPGDDVNAMSAEVRLVARPAVLHPLQTYLHLGAVDFETLGTSPGATIGTRLEGRPHSFDVALEVLQARPSLELGDEFDEADTVRLFGDYSYRVTRDLELIALGEIQQQTMQISPARDNQFMAAGAAIRYRGFGSHFSPEIGFVTGQRDVENDAEDHSQNDMYVRVRSAVTPTVYLSGRYRHRVREYDTILREDTRDQWTLSGDWRFYRFLAANVYVAIENADSTNASRAFDTETFGVGLSVRVD